MHIPTPDPDGCQLDTLGQLAKFIMASKRVESTSKNSLQIKASIMGKKTKASIMGKLAFSDLNESRDLSYVSLEI